MAGGESVCISRYNFLGACIVWPRMCNVTVLFLHRVDSIHSLLVVFRAFLGV